MSTLLNIDKTYKEWLTGISDKFRRSQIKAATSVNSEMLKFYWDLGREITEKKSQYQWGDKFFENLSHDLKILLPQVKSFSPTNLRYMQRFYLLYPKADKILPQVEEEITEQESQIVPQVGEEIFMIPWGHHKVIMDKYQDNINKAIFFVRKTIANNWSRGMLENFVDTDLYERQGRAITNFHSALPHPHGDLAQEITKDPYTFDFVSIAEDYREKELKDALENNIAKFLLELGSGFAYMGREFRIKVGSTEQFLDMLFYNTKLHCYVVVEIKTRKFEASSLGQLGTYVAAVNHELRAETDNPTIGILICKTKDNVLAKYALEAINEPIGISEYELSKLFPADFKGTLPTVEEIESNI